MSCHSTPPPAQPQQNPTPVPTPTPVPAPDPAQTQPPAAPPVQQAQTTPPPAQPAVQIEQGKPGRKPEPIMMQLPGGATFDMGSIPYTQGTKGYPAAQAFLSGENDSHKIAADLKTSVKNVQNVKSVVKRLLSSKALDSSLNSSVNPILHQGEGSSVNVSQSVPSPAVHPSYREGTPAAAGTREASVNNEERSSFSEDSQEEDERESLGISSSEEVNNAQGNRQFSEERRPSNSCSHSSRSLPTWPASSRVRPTIVLPIGMFRKSFRITHTSMLQASSP